MANRSSEEGVSPRYGWFGDDFTGATDTLATISGRGHRAFLFLDVPDPGRLRSVGPLDAVGIASASRSMTPHASRGAVVPAGRFFRDLGVRLVHYKCCSTFDSAPVVGNLATAIEALRPFVTQSAVMILGGQPSLGRYCAFSNLFAAAGDAVHRLDRHPTMSRHPATPMGEADLRRHFRDLGLDGVEGVHWPLIEDREALREMLTAPRRADAFLFDALTADHVAAVGRELRSLSEESSLLAVGASSVAEACFEDRGIAPEAIASEAEPLQVLAIAGSLSPTTRAQILAAKRYTRIAVEPSQLAASDSYREHVRERAVDALRQGRNVLVSMAPLDGDPPSSADGSLATRGATLISEVLDRHPVRRLIAAGGDTSSHVVQAIGVWGLASAGRAARGVGVCRARSDDPARDGMLLLLKGGQMGDDALFDRFTGQR